MIETTAAPRSEGVETPDDQDRLPLLPPRLWVYTNFDCNLACSYCLASSSPSAPRRALALGDFRRLVDEAAGEGIAEVFLTGGEPLLLPDIVERIRYAASRMPVTVLTNAMLIHGRRRRELEALRGLPLTLQVSLDGHEAPIHDAYRGPGSWERTVEGIRTLLGLGFRVAIGATETKVNRRHLPELVDFVDWIGIPADMVFVRPLTRRGFSGEGLEVRAPDIVPEITVTRDGVYWHPQSAGEEMLLSRELFPFASVLALMRESYLSMHTEGPRPATYRCA